MELDQDTQCLRECAEVVLPQTDQVRGAMLVLNLVRQRLLRNALAPASRAQRLNNAIVIVNGLNCVD